MVGSDMATYINSHSGAKNVCAILHRETEEKALRAMRWTTTVFCAVYVLHVLLCISAGVVEEGTIAMSAGTLSGCGTCRDNGVCDHAYKGTPGHFCHTIWWSDNKPCCCPQGYACDSDHFKCSCRKEVTAKDIETTLLIVAIAVLALVMFFVIEACVDMYKRRKEVDEEEGGGGRSSRCRLFWRFVQTLKRKHEEAKSRHRRRAQNRHHRHYHSKHNASTTLNGDDGLVYGTTIATAGASYEFNGDTGGDLEFGDDTGSNTGWTFFDFAGDSGDTTSYDFGDSFAGDS